MYNLGYLPGGPKDLRTQATSTVQSLRQAFDLLNKGGVISVCCYAQHDGGMQEREAIREWLDELPAEQARVVHFQAYNKLRAPECYLVQKMVKLGS